eukprot:jgi/Picsp_1/5828/NSC_03187-R1_2-oxoglutarate dehydrogenase e2 subunit
MLCTLSRNSRKHWFRGPSLGLTDTWRRLDEAKGLDYKGMDKKHLMTKRHVWGAMSGLKGNFMGNWSRKGADDATRCRAENDGDSDVVSMSSSLRGTNQMYDLKNHIVMAMRQHRIRGFMAGALRYSDLQVKVPPLGESITDGVIASILKQSGDAVEEDEALLQIETDKVTVDVRAPVSGIVKQILVKADDTVAVDHVVALIEEGEAPGRAEGEPPKEKKKEKVAAAEPERETATSSGKDQGISGGEVTTAHHEMPGLNVNGKYAPKICFPRRRTSDGQIISEMSAEEQERVRNDEIGARHSFFMLMRQRKVERAPLPPRRELSEKEMESIMLGGAE